MIVVGMTFTVSRLGVALGVAIFILVQMTMSLIIDHYSLFGVVKDPITWTKAFGVLLLLAGVRLMLQ
jgi:transporter family-2 protein